eukprot:204566_1
MESTPKIPRRRRKRNSSSLSRRHKNKRNTIGNSWGQNQKLLMAANDISEHAICLIKGVHNQLNYHYKRSAHLVNMNKNQLSQRSKNASNQQVFANVAYNAKPLIQKERDRVNNMKQDSIAAYRNKLQKSQ